MLCYSYCTAGAYQMQNLIEELKSRGLDPKYFDDVLYVEKKGKNKVKDIFFFPFGCVVVWCFEDFDENYLLNLLSSYSIDISDLHISDLIYFDYSPEPGKTFIDEEKNEIILGDKSELTKLSLSHALAQSVKLSLLERSVSNLLDKTSPIQTELASTGSVSLSKKEISKQVGILFNERYSINLHSDILDTPEFFWRRPSYEPIYLMTAEFQDIQIRQNILNNRLDTIHELYTMLSNEMNYKHSTRLEVTIIILIAIEVLMGIIQSNFWEYIVSFFSL